MTLTPTTINDLLIGGMIVALLLICGVLGALAGPRKKAATPVPKWADIDGFDLDGRLHHLGDAKSAVPSAASDPGEVEAPAVLGARPSAPSRPAHPAQGAPAAAPSARLALPNSGTVKIPPPAPAEIAPGQGLNPLAARFSTLETLPAPEQHVAVATHQTARQPALPGTNGLSSANAGMNVHGSDPAGRLGAARVTGGLAAETIERPSLPAGMDSRFTEAPRTEMRAAPRPSLPPSDQRVTRELPPTQQGRTHRLELPGTVAREESLAGAGQHAAPVDLHSLLRGETPAMQASPAAPPAGAASRGPADKPRFTSGPLPPAAADGAPVGAVPFDPNLLHVRPPVQPSAIVEPPRANGAKSLPPLPTSGPLPAANGAPSIAGGTSTGAASSSFEFKPASDYGDVAERERVPVNGALADFDATRLVGDFDLPDTGFETHVFSTTELLGDAPLDTMPYPSVVGDVHDAAPVAFASGPLGEPAPAKPSGLPSPVLAQLQPPLDGMAALLDVSFVRLIGADGASLLAAGKEEASPVADRAISALLNTAIMEGQQLELGACGSLSVEAPAAALLLSPLPGGLCLAVLLGNPTRLGLLRRQVRKPLAALRAALTEYGLS